MKKMLSKIVNDYIYRNGHPPDFVEYDGEEGNKQIFFVVNDGDHPDMEYEKLAFWKKENATFLDFSKNSRLNLYYYPLCPQTVSFGKKKYTFIGAVVYNNVIYVEMGKLIQGKNIEKIVISRTYDEYYMKNLEKYFNKLEWQAVENEQSEESFAQDKK
jgi:hypothetical protein